MLGKQVTDKILKMVTDESVAFKTSGKSAKVID